MHTGTNFTVGFLKALGLVKHINGLPRTKECYATLHASPNNHPTYEFDFKTRISDAKVLVPARDPILASIRCLKDGRPRVSSMPEIVKAWDVFLEKLPQIDYYIIDVATPEEKRYELLRGAVEHIGHDADALDSTIQAYADAWKPLNTSTSPGKSSYLETGEAPDSVDVKGLAKAIEWYNSFK